MAAPPLAAATLYEDQKVLPHGFDPGDTHVRFGSVVDMSGPRAIVGSPYEDVGGVGAVGGAYVYEHDGVSWVEVAKLAPTDPSQAESFGGSVAISGATALVGARGAASAGEVHFYARVPGSVPGAWVLAQTFAPTGGAWGLGDNVALHGDRAAASAHPPYPGELAWIFVYERSGGTWSQVQVLEGPYVTELSWPEGLALRGDYLAVGAEWHDDREGLVRLYRHDGSGFAEVAEIGNPYPAEESRFGRSVAVGSDGTVLVGAPYDARAARDAGAAFRFTAADGWSRAVELQPFTRQESQLFGESVALAGTQAVVGAFGDGAYGSGLQWTFPGAAFLFRDTRLGWLEITALRATDSPPSEWLGHGVAHAGDRALVGAPAESSGAVGSAYFYSGLACDADEEPPVVVEYRDLGKGSQKLVFGDDVSVETVEVEQAENVTVTVVAPDPEWWESGGEEERTEGGPRRAPDGGGVGSWHFDEHPPEVELRLDTVVPTLPTDFVVVARDPCGGETSVDSETPARPF